VTRALPAALLSGCSYLGALWACVLLAYAAAGCDEQTPREPDASAEDAALGADAAPGDADLDVDGGADSTSFLDHLRGAEDYAALQGEGAEVKYLAMLPDARPSPPLDTSCIFQDTARFAFHVQFLRSFPAYADLDYDSYLALVLRRQSRLWWGGGLKLFAGVRHPLSGQRGVISFTAYQDGGGEQNLTPEELQALFMQLSACAPYARELLVFVPDGGAQVAHVRGLRETLSELGVPVLMPEELGQGLGAQVYSEGEAYGYLRIVPRGELLREHGPRDVIVVQSAPADLALAAALISEHPQSEHSHVNLRLREKGVPNASSPDVYQNALLATLAGTLVHVRARAQQFEIEPARSEDAEAFWATHRPVLRAPRADLEIEELRPFSRLRAVDAAAFGTKAANLGELYAILPEQHRTQGFGIPFSAYAALLRESELDGPVRALLDDPALQVDAALRRQRLAALRDAIKDAALPAGLADKLQAAVLEIWGEPGLSLRLKFRSSTNAEDLETLSGAGLYDSKAGCLADDLDADSAGPSHCLTEADAAAYRATLDAQREELAAHPERSWLQDSIADLEQELSQEKSALSALRKVWASLWTERAFEERAYYGIDHAQVFMGLAVNPSFTREQLDCVAVTNLPSAEAPLYRLVTQTAEIGVVEPLDPSATPETLVFHRQGDAALDPQLLVRSSRADAMASLWPEAQLTELELLLFQIQDHFASAVYPDTDPLSLDLEIKLDRDGQVVVKQVRPYRLLAP
jgi:pyruvate,water dikinase